MDRTLKLDSKRVYALSCSCYGEAEVKKCVYELLEKQTDELKFEISGKNVLLKPNLLAKREPNMAVTTNPQILKFTAMFFSEKGANVIVADSPGGIYNLGILKGIYKVCEIEKAALEGGAELNFDTGYQNVSADGEKSKNFDIINPIVKADLVVNLPRLKTHALCEMSAAVKNMFGSIPGLMKAEMHARFPKRVDFASMLLDLCLLTAPEINILDAVICMEGNGPAGGTPKKVGLMLGSVNPFVLDRVGAYLMGYEANEVGTLHESIKRGLAPEKIEEVEILGENIESYKSAFLRPDGHAGGIVKQIPTLFGGRLQKWLEPKPVIITKKCIGCGECERCCPVKTIEVKNRKAYINPEKCIKCYCCQELCPMKAVEVKRKKFLKF